MHVAVPPAPVPVPAASRPAPPDSRPNSGLPEPILDAATLLAGKRELQLRHGDRLYRLRLTAAGKLLLTK